MGITKPTSQEDITAVMQWNNDTAAIREFIKISNVKGSSEAGRWAAAQEGISVDCLKKMNIANRKILEGKKIKTAKLVAEPNGTLFPINIRNYERHKQFDKDKVLIDLLVESYFSATPGKKESKGVEAFVKNKYLPRVQYEYDILKEGRTPLSGQFIHKAVKEQTVQFEMLQSSEPGKKVKPLKYDDYFKAQSNMLVTMLVADTARLGVKAAYQAHISEFTEIIRREKEYNAKVAGTKVGHSKLETILQVYKDNTYKKFDSNISRSYGVNGEQVPDEKSNLARTILNFFVGKQQEDQKKLSLKEIATDMLAMSYGIARDNKLMRDIEAEAKLLMKQPGSLDKSIGAGLIDDIEEFNQRILGTLQKSMPANSPKKSAKQNSAQLRLDEVHAAAEAIGMAPEAMVGKSVRFRKPDGPDKSQDLSY